MRLNSLIVHPSLIKRNESIFSRCARKYVPVVDDALEESSKIGIALQQGYFKATGKFYKIKKYRAEDVRYVAKMLGLPLSGKFTDSYPERSRRNHKRLILKTLGFKTYKEEENLFENVIENLVSKHMAPRKILFSVVDLIRSKKIEVPNYDTFSRTITAQFNTFESNVIESVKKNITPAECKALVQQTLCLAMFVFSVVIARSEATRQSRF